MDDTLTLEGMDFVPGRIVRFVDPTGKHYPMVIVTAMKDLAGANHRIDGVAFGEFGAKYFSAVPYDQKATAGTWFWPPRRSRNKVVPPKPQPGKPLYTPRTVAPSPRSQSVDRKRGSR